ncbi:MAG: TlpA disulfide reductase family protein [Ignavibacteriales bacterium]|nr:TlpA disulfide reductase family protein [Ignavibacteriales bacterium]
MSKKTLGKKKYSPSFFQRNRKFIYTVSIFGIIVFLLLLNNSKSLFGQGESDGSLPSNYAGSIGNKPVASPNFNLTTVDGKHLKLSDYKGKVVIVDFWATWCSPCRRGIPDLISLKRKYGPRGFEVVGVSVDTDTKEDVIPFVQQNWINYPVVYADTDVTERYGGINSIPTSFIIDKNGMIVASFQGLNSISVYEDYINKLL